MTGNSSDNKLSRATIIGNVIVACGAIIAAIIGGYFLLQSIALKENSGATATAISAITLIPLPTYTPFSILPTYTPLPTYTAQSTIQLSRRIPSNLSPQPFLHQLH